MSEQRVAGADDRKKNGLAYRFLAFLAAGCADAAEVALRFNGCGCGGVAGLGVEEAADADGVRSVPVRKGSMESATKV
jgi:hypothetical protein